MSKITVEMTADEAKVLRAFQKATEAAKKFTGGLGETARKAKEAAEKEKELGRAAKQVLAEIRTPQERYNRQLEKLKTLLQAGKINQNQYGRAAKLAGDKLREAGRAGKKAGTTAGKAFNPGILKKYAGLLAGGTGILSIAGAFAAVIKCARAAQEEIKGVAAQLRETYDGMKELWQVSESKEVYRSISARTKLAAAQEGIDQPTVQKLAFNLKSLSRLEALPAIIKSARFMDPAIAAKFYTTLSSSTTWGREIGTPGQVLSGLVAGAGKSAFATGETAQWAGRVAPTMKNLGATPAEILGVGAAISTPAQKPEILGTYMFALEKQLSNYIQKLTDEGLEAPKGIIPTFEALMADPEARRRAMGELRFKRAAIALEKALPEAKRYTEEIAVAFGSEEEFKRKIDVPRELSIQQRTRIAEMQKQVGLEELAIKQTELNTAIERNKALAGFARKSITIESAWESALQTGATFGMVENATRAARQRYVENMHRWFPKVYEKHIADVVPKKLVKPAPSIGMSGPGVIDLSRPMVPDVPRYLPAELQKAFSEAMNSVVEKSIGRRHGYTPAPAAAAPLAPPRQPPHLMEQPTTKPFLGQADEEAPKQTAVLGKIHEQLGQLNERLNTTPHTNRTLGRPDEDR